MDGRRRRTCPTIRARGVEDPARPGDGAPMLGGTSMGQRVGPTTLRFAAERSKVTHARIRPPIAPGSLAGPPGGFSLDHIAGRGQPADHGGPAACLFQRHWNALEHEHEARGPGGGIHLPRHGAPAGARLVRCLRAAAAGLHGRLHDPQGRLWRGGGVPRDWQMGLAQWDWLSGLANRGCPNSLPPGRSQHYGPERGLFGRTITVWLREPGGSVCQRPVIMRLFESNSVDSLYEDVLLNDGDVLLGVGQAFNLIHHQVIHCGAGQL
jgi:hypothetical protein